MSNLALSMRFVESCHWYTIAWNTNCLSSNNKKHRDSFYDLNGNIISSAHMISDTYINIIHWLDVQRRVGNWYMISSLSFILIISPEPHSILLLAPTYIPVSNMLDSPPVRPTNFNWVPCWPMAPFLLGQRKMIYSYSRLLLKFPYIEFQTKKLVDFNIEN